MPVSQPVSLTDASAKVVIRTLLMTDLVESTHMVEQLGDHRAYEIAARHDRAARDLLRRFDGLEIDKTDGFLLLFERPIDAVAYALTYHRTLARLSRELGVELVARAGIHLGEVLLHENSPADVDRGAKRLEVEGIAKPMTARVMSLALGGQTLLTHSASDLARRSAVGAVLPMHDVTWLAHGSFQFKGVDESVEIFEAGEAGRAPLSVPPSSEKAKRMVAPGDEITLGWRPAPDQQIPLRPNWTLKERLGVGGFGEVWLATQDKTDDNRVFKFCLEADRLRSLQREVTLFRLLKESLGHRDDIARVLDWNFEQAPYFLESEYTEGGNLVDWAEERGGLRTVPLAVRLELVAQVAEALAAAHSVGILHKDVKPTNVLVATDHAGQPKARLTDFGIGRVVDEKVLVERGITMLGLTEVMSPTERSAATGTYVYMAPEVIEGKVATIQADIYAVGVMLYQMVIGDLAHPLAPGWRRDVPDYLLAEDIAQIVDGSPERRPTSASEVADRLRRLEERRAEAVARRARDKTEHRRKLFAAFGGVATVVLLVVSVLAIQATRARREADLRRDQAENLISFMLGDLRTKLEPLGRLEILNEVGEKALDYFAAVPEEDLTDEEVLRRSQALMQIGEVRLAEADSKAAMEAFEESLALATELVSRNAENIAWQKELASRHFWVGRVLWDQGELEGALIQFKIQRAIAQRLADANPDDSDLQLDLAFALNNIGFVHQARGDLDGALEAGLETLAIKQELAGTQPQDSNRQLTLAASHNAVGAILLQLGELASSLTHLGAEHEIKRALVELNPANTRWRLQLAISHNFVGRALAATGDRDGAGEHFRESLAITKDLVALDPANTDWRHELAVFQRRVGLDLMARGEPVKALEHVGKGLEILIELVAKDPTKTKWRRNLATGYLSVGTVLSSRGDFAGARDRARSALELLELLVEKNPQDRQSLLRMSEGHLLLGRALEGLGEPAVARLAWQRAVTVIEPLASDSRDLDFLEPWAQALLRLDRTAEAESVLQKIRAVRQSGLSPPSHRAASKESSQPA